MYKVYSKRFEYMKSNFHVEKLKQLWKDKKLVFSKAAERFKNHYAFQELLDNCYKKEWIPY